MDKDNDYFGMLEDLRAMKRRFYDFANHYNTFRFILNWEEEDFLNELCLFEDHCFDMSLK